MCVGISLLRGLPCVTGGINQAALRVGTESKKELNVDSSGALHYRPKNVSRWHDSSVKTYVDGHYGQSS
jgi:hypothetical protein